MTNDVREERNRDLETLKAEVEKLRADIGSASRAIKDISAALGADAFGRVRETAKKAGDQAQKAADTVSQQIEERPLISVVTAFVMGLLLGALFSRVR